MKKRLSGFYYIIPVVYIGLILFFVYMQITSREVFSEKIGNITLSGTISPKVLIGRREIAELQIGFSGFNLMFSRNTPLTAIYEDGSSEKLKITAYTSFTNGVELEFRKSILLRFDLIGSLGDKIALKITIPDRLKQIKSLSIPFKVSDGKIESVHGIPIITLESGPGTWFISLPSGSEVDLKYNRLEVNTGVTEPGISFERVQNEDPLVYWFTRDLPPLNQDTYDERVNDYLDNAFLYWKQISLSAEGRQADVETVGIALLSEALIRGEHRLILPVFSKELRNVIRSNPDLSMPYLTTPYLGGLPSYLQKRQMLAVSQINQVTEMIRQSDYTVFRTPDLIRFILDHAPFSLMEEAARLADSMEVESVSIESLLFLLDAYLEMEQWLGASEAAASRVSEIVLKRILPAIQRTEQGLFLLSSQEVEIFLSIKAGRLLIRAADIINKPAVASIGRNLILSALNLADSEGFLPAACKLESNRILRVEGSLYPDIIYALIAEKGYLPQEYPLYKHLYPGTWIWSISRLNKISIEQKRYRFSFSFPERESHYLIIQGLPAFKNIQLHGIYWKPDPQYFIYTDGWYYNEESQTLFIKITHRKKTEEIVVNY